MRFFGGPVRHDDKDDKDLARQIGKLREAIMSLQADVQALTDEVTANTNVVSAVMALINGFVNQVQAGINAENLAAVQAAVTAFKANDATLAAAVAAGTT